MNERNVGAQAPYGYCTNCGKALEEGMAFCTECGTPVVPAASCGEPPAPAGAPVAPPSPPKKQGAKSGVNVVLVIALVVVVLALVALIVFLVFGARTYSTLTQETPGAPTEDVAIVSDGSSAASGSEDVAEDSSSGVSSADRSPAGSSSSAAEHVQDYILPDSATRVYSVSELEELSTYELYLARNEVFARHGRMFKNEDLQQYFGAKPWYHPTVAPEDFKNEVLNDAERKNTELIVEVEKRRDSPYLE